MHMCAFFDYFSRFLLQVVSTTYSRYFVRVVGQKLPITTPGTPSGPPSTELASLSSPLSLSRNSSAISLDCRNLRLFLGWLILPQHTHSFKIMWLMIVKQSETESESTTQPKVWKKRMVPHYTVLLFVACHHIAVTQMVCGHLLSR